jgi:hypothetical protein
MARARSATQWYETFRVTGRKHGRKEERQARAALKRAISAAEGDDDAVGLQLFGQSMAPGVYERFRPIANQNMRRRRIIQTLPDSRGQTMVVVWGLEAGTEVVPTLSTRDFPTLLGTTVAIHCAGDAPDGPAFVSGVLTWLQVNTDEAPHWRPAPPLLQRWRIDGSKAIETIDFGLSYPLPALDIVAA